MSFLISKFESAHRILIEPEAMPGKIIFKANI